MDKSNVHTREYYWEIKRNGVLIHAIKWMNLKNMMLSERSQLQRIYIIPFHLHEMFNIGKSTERKETDGGQKAEKEEWEGTANGTAKDQDPFWGDEHGLGLGSDEGCTIL